MRQLVQLNSAPSPHQPNSIATSGISTAWLVLLCIGLNSLCLAGCSGCFAPKTQMQPSTPTTAEPVSTPQTDESATTSAEAMTVQRHPSAESVASNSTEKVPNEENDTSESFPDASVPAVAGQPSRTGKPPADAESTLKTVGALREKARRATSKKEFGSAFSLATQAWEAARSHPKDIRLQQIAEELTVELDTLGKQSNAKFGSKASDPSTRLIEK